MFRFAPCSLRYALCILLSTENYQPSTDNCKLAFNLGTLGILDHFRHLSYLK